MANPKAKMGKTTQQVREFLSAHPDATTKEIAQAISVSTSTAGYHLTKINKENKKNVRSKRSKSGDDHATSSSVRLQVQQAYLLGSVEQLVRFTAARHQLPFSTLAAGLAVGLHAAANGELLRPTD